MISARRQNGRFYTPAAVADLTVAVALGDRWPPKGVLDPSCGDGALLSAVRRRGLSPAALVGRDNDPVALERARAELPGSRFEETDLFLNSSDERFSAIVGNPPYVRNDRLAAGTKEAIKASLGLAYPALETDTIVGRGDLAACALLRAIAMLEPRGRLGFVVSAALLEADYAEAMWRALGDHGQVLDIVTAPGERWFREAAVNTIVLVFERGARGPTRLSRLRHPTETCAKKVGSAAELELVADVRVDAGGSPKRWAHLLRAPPLWLELESSPALVSLGEVAEIRRGITSGANDVFYMSRAKAKAHKIEPRALFPLVRAPLRSGSVAIEIEPERIDDMVLRAPLDLAGTPNAAAFLADRADAKERASLRVRDPWWRLPSRPAQIFLAKAYARRFVQRFSRTPLDCDQRVYAVSPAHGICPRLLAAVLNGTLTALAIESLGRASMGEGALEWTVADARSLPIIDPRRMTQAAQRLVLSRFDIMASRPVEACELEAERTDRFGLDEALLGIDPRLAGFATDLASSLAESAALREARAKSPRRATTANGACLQIVLDSRGCNRQYPAMENKRERVFPAERLTIGRRSDGSDVTIVVAGELNTPEGEQVERARLNLAVLDADGRVLFADDTRISVDDQATSPVRFSKRFGCHARLLKAAHRLYLSVSLRSSRKLASWRFEMRALSDPSPLPISIAKSGSMTATRERPDAGGEVRMAFYAGQALPEGLTNRGTRLKLTALDDDQDVIFVDDTMARDRTGSTDDLRLGERFHLKEWVLARSASMDLELIGEQIRDTSTIEVAWVELVDLTDDD